tara:strand:- start:247 stop:630 length:384 start_codon:yes stop_codon:yes gene_type:complete
MKNIENKNTDPITIVQTEEDLARIKNYYLDSQYGKYAINYIEEKFPDTYKTLELDKLDPEKEYGVVFQAVVIAENTYDTLYANIPYEHANRKGNEGIFKTTLMMYDERAQDEMRAYIDDALTSPEEL